MKKNLNFAHVKPSTLFFSSDESNQMSLDYWSCQVTHQTTAMSKANQQLKEV